MMKETGSQGLLSRLEALAVKHPISLPYYVVHTTLPFIFPLSSISFFHLQVRTEGT